MRVHSGMTAFTVWKVTVPNADSLKVADLVQRHLPLWASDSRWSAKSWDSGVPQTAVNPSMRSSAAMMKKLAARSADEPSQGRWFGWSTPDLAA